MQRVKSLAGNGFMALIFVITFWPGHILNLVPTVRAAFGSGTPGVVVLDERISGRSPSFRGDYRSDDGRVVRDDVIYAPQYGDPRRHAYELGDRVPVLFNQAPDLVINLGDEVYPRTGNTEWIFPAVVTGVWIGVLVWAAYRVRTFLRRRGLLRERAPATSPPCSCADPGRCGHG